MAQFDNFPEDFSDCSTATAEYEDQITDLADINVQSMMTDMTEMTPLPDDVLPTEYFEMEALKNRIFSNAPPPIEYFIGEQHESLYNSVFDDLTYDNMNPFIVLLGSEGIGKTTITTSICNELLHENNQLFKDGIVYLDLMHWYNEHKYNTFEQCLIGAVQQSGLDAHWISKHDDFLELLPSNIFTKIDQYLSNSLIIIEDFDRFMDANHISLEQCNQFLFSLFENISLQTKIIVTSRKKLPIYYNFNAFRTKFYEISGFNEADAIQYLLTYCPSFRKQDIVPYLNDIRDLTSYKPLYMHSLYKLWQSVRLFESTFDSIITLYQQLDHPQLLIAHNPYNNVQKHNSNDDKDNCKPSAIQTSKDQVKNHTNTLRLTVSQSSSSSASSPPHNGVHVASPIHEMKPKEDEIHELQGLQPLFAYTNLYCAPNSPSLVEYHSPLSTMNGPTLNLDYRPKTKKKKSSKHTRPRSYTPDLPTAPFQPKNKKATHKKLSKGMHNSRKRNASVGLNLQLLDPKRRRSDQVQSFYKVNTIAKHTQRYSFDANYNHDMNGSAPAQTEEVRQIILSSDRDDSKDDHYRFAPLSPLSPLQLHRNAGINIVNHHNGSKSAMNMQELHIHMNKTIANNHHKTDSNDSMFQFAQEEDEREKKRRKKKTNSGTFSRENGNGALLPGIKPRRDTPRVDKSAHTHTLSANNLKTHLNILLLGDLNISESGTIDSNLDEILAIEGDNPDIIDQEPHDGDAQSVCEKDGDEEEEHKETYDGFLSALGAEIQRQQKEETKHDTQPVEIDNEDSQSMQNYKLRINDMDINENRTRSLSVRPNIPPGYSLPMWDLPATPPLSSCGGIIDSECGWGDNDMDDNMSVNSDTMRQNKLISIKLIKNQDDNTKALQHNDMKYVQHMTSHPHTKDPQPQPPRTTVGDVHFNKFLRMTLLLNIAIESWSRKWLINGVARSLRTADMRFSVHKAEDIATKYSYVSLLCRCDEYDIKQLKHTFEFSFISHELEECVAESLGQPQLKIICASCVSYRHFKYLYSKEFLNWMQHSLPNAQTVNDYDPNGEDRTQEDGGSRIKQNRNGQIYHHLNHNIVQRKEYSIRGMHKMSIMNAEHIQLPFAQKDISSQDPMNAQQKPLFHQSFGVRRDSNNNTNDDGTIKSPLLTPRNMTVLHFMSVMS